MSILPYNRVVNVTLDRNDAFPSRRGFGTPLMLSTTALSGIVDLANRTKLYASMDEVASDWAAGSDVYEAAQTLFSQNPRPRQFKVGYVELDSTPTESELETQLDALYAADAIWQAV